MRHHFSRWYQSNHPYGRYKKALLHKEEILSFRKKASEILDKEFNDRWHLHLTKLHKNSDVHTDFTSDTVMIGREGEIDQQQKQLLMHTLKDLKFWRKGPFSYFGTRIDAEWQSNMKWDRVMELIAPDLENKIICDIGCNNLYYMYRMLPSNPSLVIGIEPMAKYFFHHYLNRLYFNDPAIHFELMGIDDLNIFEKFFDVVFCMGILYHRRNPLLSLERMGASMKKGALLVMETAGIPGEEPVCLLPEGRYMKAPGWWFLPTVPALEHMLKRTGFTDITIHGVFDSSIEEQRVTPWTTKESLAEFLDPEDSSKTVEGYPAARRIYLSARKRY